MPIQDVRLSPNEQEFHPLGEWAKKLSIPAWTLLHHGSQGDLKLFALPPRDAAFYSVHEDYLGSLLTELPYEAQPISTAGPGVMGLVLSRRDLAQLSTGAKIEQRLFDAIILKQDGWGNLVPPIEGRIGGKLRANSWRIAAYKIVGSATETDSTIRTPITVKVSPGAVYLRDVDVRDFIDRIESHAFISDMFDGSVISEDLPSYVSGKLREVIDANRLFWRNNGKINAVEKERRRAGALNFLQGDFLDLCEKTINSESLIKFAAHAADPTLLPSSQYNSSTYVTPTLLALLSAAKMYWSAHYNGAGNLETYPDRDAIKFFLQFMGMREPNAAVAGTTLIRPESVRKPSPVKSGPSWRATGFRRRQGLQE